MGTVTLTPLGYGSYLSTDTKKWQSSANVMHTGVDGQYSDGHYYNYISALKFTTGTAGAKGITVTLKTGGGGSNNNQCPGNVVAYLSKTFTSWKQAWNLYGSATALTSSATSGNSWVKGEQNYTFTTSAVLDPSQTYYVFIRASGTWTGGDKPSSTRHTNWSVAGGSADITVTDDTRTLSLSGDGGISATSGAGTKSLNSVVNIDATVKSGYTWKKWLEGTTSFSSTKNTTVTMDKNRTLNATTDVITYSISYDHVGGSLPSGKTNPSTYNVTTAAFTLNNPSKSYYTFTGWTGSNSSTTPSTSVTIATNSTGNKSYTANYTPVNYSISYTMNGGSLASGKTNPTSYNYETAAFTLNNPSKSYYTFDGWTGTGLSSASKSVTVSKGSHGARSYTANFTPIDYKITYIMSGGSWPSNSVHPTSYNYETAAFIIAQPTQTGYTFAGWTGTGLNSATKSVTVATKSNGDRTYTATWTANSYKVAYDGNKSTSGSMDASNHVYGTSKNLTKNTYKRAYTVTYNHNYTSSTNTTKTGTYTFDGWNTNSSGTGTSYADEESVTNLATSGTKTLYAQWDNSTAKISYTPTRTGYRFGGWYTTSECTTEVTHPYTPTEDKTFYADWDANTYTVSYNGNGHTGGSTASSSHTYDVSKSLTSNGFTKTGYTFAGWATSSTGAVVHSNGKSVTNLTSTHDGTVTLYAKWTPITYSIAYNKNNGSGTTMSNSTHTYDTAKALTANTYSRAGYTFDSWNTKADGTGTSYSDRASVKNLSSTKDATVTLYAQWNADDGTAYKVQHWKQKIGAGTTQNTTNFDLAETDSKTGTTGNTTVATAKSYTGFTAQSFNQSTISGDGTTTVNIYYHRVSYTLSAEKGTGISSITVDTGSHQFGETINISANVSSGYTWSGWTSSGTSITLPSTSSGSITMPAGAVKVVANAVANTDTKYTVNHWKQNLDATSDTSNSTNYTKVTADTQTLSGTTATNTAAKAKSYSGFTAKSFSQKTIAGGGTTVVDIYYTRNSYTVMLTSGTGVASVTGGGSYKYGANVTVKATMATGYSWSSWSGDKSSTSIEYEFTMPAQNLTLTANSTADGFTVTYVGQNGKQTLNPSSSSNISVSIKYDAQFTVRDESNAFYRTGYKFLGWATSANSKIVDTARWVPGRTFKWDLTNSVTLYAVWKSKGVLYVDTGSNFIPYTIWIDSGNSTGGPNNDGWYQYTAWLDTGDTSQGNNGWVQLGSMPD